MPQPNHILSNLPRADFILLEPHLDQVLLVVRQSLEAPNRPVRDIYFPQSGIVSVVATSAAHQEIEAGIIGFEGMTGLPVVMGDDRTPNSTFVQIAGQSMRINAAVLRKVMQESDGLRVAFLHFAQAFMAQTSHTLLANGRATIEQRLARWLLMAQDRLGGNEISLTHEFMAVMLGVQRPGLTVVLKQLRKQTLIAARRGTIVVTNRKGLEGLAGGIYGVPEAEYRRLIGWAPVKS